MNRAFPYAEINPGQEHLQMLTGVSLPDEDDRHVLAAALAAEATVLCTSNTKDFPPSVVDSFGIDVVTPDQLLTGSWTSTSHKCWPPIGKQSHRSTALPTNRPSEPSVERELQKQPR